MDENDEHIVAVLDERIVAVLRENQLFSALTEEERGEIVSGFTLRTVKEHETIFSEGDPSKWLYFAAEGRVKIVKHTPEGKDVILEVISPPEVFGGVAVLDGRPYPGSAVAMDKGYVVRMGRVAFFELLDRFPVLALEVSIYFGERLRNAYDMLRSVAVERVERRIGSLLVRFGERLGRPDGDNVVMEMGLTMQEIAEMVGTTVETTIRTMNKFRSEGLVQYGKGTTVITPALRKKLAAD